MSSEGDKGALVDFLDQFVERCLVEEPDQPSSGILRIGDMAPKDYKLTPEILAEVMENIDRRARERDLVAHNRLMRFLGVIPEGARSDPYVTAAAQLISWDAPIHPKDAERIAEGVARAVRKYS